MFTESDTHFLSLRLKMLQQSEALVEFEERKHHVRQVERTFCARGGVTVMRMKSGLREVPPRQSTALLSLLSSSPVAQFKFASVVAECTHSFTHSPTFRSEECVEHEGAVLIAGLRQLNQCISSGSKQSMKKLNSFSCACVPVAQATYLPSLSPAASSH